MTAGENYIQEETVALAGEETVALAGEETVGLACGKDQMLESTKDLISWTVGYFSGPLKPITAMLTTKGLDLLQYGITWIVDGDVTKDQQQEDPEIDLKEQKELEIKNRLATIESKMQALELEKININNDKANINKIYTTLVVVVLGVGLTALFKYLNDKQKNKSCKKHSTKKLT